jgi:nicotinamide-nucleotide amidase
MMAAAITDIPGSSAVFEFGFVAYANKAKSDLLGVPSGAIEKYGAVSAEVARAMAEGALARSGADIAAAVTGIAGPDGGTKEKPVGLVWFGLARRGDVRVERRLFANASRAVVRTKSVETALLMIKQAIDAA